MLRNHVVKSFVALALWLLMHILIISLISYYLLYIAVIIRIVLYIRNGVFTFIIIHFDNVFRCEGQTRFVDSTAL